MSEYNLGTARGTIEVEYKGDGATRAREDIDATRRSSERAAPSLSQYGEKAGVAGLVMAGGFAIAAKSAGDFEQKMSAVQSVAGASADEMDALRDKALQLGKETAFSAGESAGAMEELAKAGLGVEDILNGAADATVALAAAGSVDMPTAAAIATSAMNNFGIAADESARVADLFAGAANKSATDVTELGMAIRNVGPIANSTGTSLEDTTTALALLAKNGLSGSRAGTALAATMRQLNPQSKAAQDALKDLGIITEDGSNRFFDAEGNMKSLSEVSGILAKSTKNLTNEQKQAQFTKIFGSEGFAGVAALTKAGADGFDEMAESIGQVSAAEVAATKMDNFKGSLEEMLGSLETLGITIGTLLLPALRGFVDGITSLLNVFLNLPSGVQTAIVAFLGLITLTLLALGAFVKITKGIQAVALAFKAVRAAAIPAWLAALGPIALVIIAIAAVVAIIVLLWKKSETFRNIVTAVWDAVKAGAEALANWIKGPFVNFFKDAWSSIQDGLGAMKDFFVSVWDGILAVVGAVVGAIATVIKTYVLIWKTIITTALNIIMGFWKGFWSIFGGVITAAFNVIVQLIKLAWTIIKGVFLLNLMAIMAITRAVWNGIMAVIRAVWNVIKNVVRAGVNFVKSIVTSVWNVIRAVTSAVWNGIMAVIRAVWARIGGTVKSAVSSVKNAITNAWNAVKNTTTKMWNAVKDAVSDAVSDLVDKVTSIKDKVLDALSGAGTWLYQKGKDIIQGLLDGITSMLGKVGDGIGAVTGKLSKFLPGSPVKEGPLTVLNRGYAGGQIVKMIAGGMEDEERYLERTINALVSVPALASDLDRVSQTSSAAALTGVDYGRNGRGSGGSATGREEPLRLVEGKLSIDRNGKAYIKGLARDTYDDEERFEASHERMG